jgi:hypothetical protein
MLREEVMSVHGGSDEVFERLIALNRETFAAGLYETAYHTLAAALHRALFLESDALLDSVATLASAQLRHIDLFSPTHTLSSHSATDRGQRNSYGALVELATSCARLIRHRRDSGRQSRTGDAPS